MTKPTRRGGPGRGQGRKPEYSEPMKSYRVTLDERTVEEAKRIGGNISKGIRIAISALANMHGRR